MFFFGSDKINVVEFWVMYNKHRSIFDAYLIETCNHASPELQEIFLQEVRELLVESTERTLRCNGCKNIKMFSTVLTNYKPVHVYELIRFMDIYEKEIRKVTKYLCAL